MTRECEWVRAFDGHFNIMCPSGERGNGNFRSGKWEFIYCPYCGGKIKEPKKTIYNNSDK